MPELQRIAQTMGIPGAGRMRKGQLVEAIEARQGGAPRQETGAANQGSDQRVASAGADSTRLRKQDPMEPDTRTQPGIGDGATAGLGDSARGGIGADGAGRQQQLSFDREAVTDGPNGRAQAPAQVPAQEAPAHQAGSQETAAAPQGIDAQPGEAAQGEAQRGDRRRRNGRRDDQPSRGRDQAARDQSGRDNGGRDQNTRDQGSRDQGSRDQGSRDNGGRDSGGQERGGQERGGRDREPMAASRGPAGDQYDDDRRGRSRDRFRNRNRRRDRQADPEPVIGEDDVLIPIAGILDVLEAQGYAFVRTTGYLPGPNDVYVSLSQVRKHGLRKGDVIEGAVRQPHDGERREKFNALVRLDKVNGLDPEKSVSRPEFSKLVPLYPQDRLRLETDAGNMTTRIIDLICPIGKGQRGLIVSPPKAGKTMILQAIANAITKNNPECHLMVVLVDERPEEVTDMQVIFEEFKGTGNMELRLRRELAEKRLFPAVDVDASSTRKEEILLSPDELKIVWQLRRVLHALEPQQALELLMEQMRKTKSNAEFLLQVQKTTLGS
jgi:transcription termination factor Rho